MQQRIGLHVEALAAKSLPPEVKAFGRVLDPAPFVALVAELETAKISLAASQKAAGRAKGLFQAGTNTSAQTLEAAEAALEDLTHEQAVAVIRRTLRREFIQAGMGISGVNFAVAETGTIVLISNEGNARLTTALPKTHIAIMGMEKVIPTMTDLMVFLAILARSATGQKLSSYTTLVRGPRQPGDDRTPLQCLGHRPDRLEIVLGGDRKPRLHHVHAEPGQLLGQLDLFSRVHAAPGRLLAVAQGGVEDDDPV